jgi:transglutaminase-like putative cysteine protease
MSIKQPKATPFIDNSLSLMLLLITVLNISLLVAQLHNAMIGFIALVLVIRFYALQTNQIINKWLTFSLAIAGCAVLVFLGKTLGVLGAMVHLLVFAYVLKPLELRKKSDFLQLSLLALFVLATSLIYQQSLLFSAVVIILLAVNFTLLIQFHAPKQSLIHGIKTSTTLLMQSIPLALVLFIVLPRLTPFWQVPLAKVSKTGLSDHVSIGDISNLVRSEALAFRVKFADKAPPFTAMYWRALVMSQFDGQRWTINQFTARESQNNVLTPEKINSSKQTIYRYQVIVEPNNQSWVFNLKKAYLADQQGNIKLKFYQDDTIESTTPIVQSSSYYLNSSIVSAFSNTLSATPDHSLSELQRRTNLHFPLQSNPKLQQEGNRLRQIYHSDKKIINAVLTHIRQNNYRYTLNPPLLAGNSLSQLDQFYFSTQAGFCVHYASTFTFLMRAAGIPARLVTGYMGGKFNPNGEYFSLYQYDAHAWSEVWLEGKGWTRVDPTAAVSPERVEQGYSNELFANDIDYASQLFNFARINKNALFMKLKQSFQALDFQWTRWVVSFNADKQSALLQKLVGQMSSLKLALMLLLSFSVVFLLLYLTQYRYKQIQPFTPWLIWQHKLLKCLEKYNIHKKTAQTLQDLTPIIEQQQPQLVHEFTRFVQLFNQLNYQRVTDENKKDITAELQILYKQIRKKLKKR